MSVVLRSLVLRWAVTFFSSVVLLPPGAWSLCSSPDGHWAFEPTANACAESPAVPFAVEGGCSTASHEACSDLVLASGHAMLRSADEGHIPSHPLVALTTPDASSPLLTPHHAVDLDRVAPSAAKRPERSAVLRC